MLHNFHAHEVSAAGAIVNFGQGQMTQLSLGNGIEGPHPPAPNIAVNQLHKYVFGVYYAQRHNKCRMVSGIT